MMRPVEREDVPAVLDLTRALARRHGDEHPIVFARVVEVDGEVVGFATWHLLYSGWGGKAGIWLMDLFVDEKARGQGHGKALIRELIELCKERDYCRLEWKCATTTPARSSSTGGSVLRSGKIGRSTCSKVKHWSPSVRGRALINHVASPAQIAI